ncbi:chemotaxis protein CheW [Marinobacterium weihaiense]|uniref:Chemotaxis protein CheW n=1 Tax=Marinobacterium weihaiense TaxID=2851016 RepID=A0ABS6MFQ1_9GAMM|nr:chemotaxis protein CheW [Marinobacterium weihaiense]MBV0934532.1 chemotaxis protein CheW [Marinobacterium weihaiense]
MDDLIQGDQTDLPHLPGQEEMPDFDEIRHGFELNDRYYMLSADTFSELAARSRVCSLPDSPPWFRGFINHRGHTVPVYDLPYMASQERTDLRKPYWILLVDQQPHTAGFILTELPTAIIDPVHESNRLNDDAEVPKALHPFLVATYQAQGQHWFELDHRALLKQLKKTFYQPAALFE